MNKIDSYEKYCKAFKGNIDDKNKAKLLLFLQNWIIRLCHSMNEEETNYNLDSLLLWNAHRSNYEKAKKDALSRLIDDSKDVVRQISKNMREKILRENVKLPVYKVREVNSYGMNWLSRRPGRNIKEKISSSNASMMAVQRRMSLDTGENRLFMAYLKEIAELLQIKIDNITCEQISSDEFNQLKGEKLFYSHIFSIIKDSDLEEIKRWENMPPNNTLLSDQYYKKIWRCWNELKQIDNIISADDKYISNRLCKYYFICLLTQACKFFRFPQIPVEINYETYSVKLFANNFYGIDLDGKALRIELQDTSVSAFYGDKVVQVIFEGTKLCMYENDKLEHNFDVIPESMYRYVNLSLLKLGCQNKIDIPKKEYPKVEKLNSVIINLFSIRPQYCADEGEIKQLQGRLLYQEHRNVANGIERKYYIPCDKANAIEINNNIKTFSVSSAVEDAVSTQMSKLIHLLGRYILANTFTFMFPDIYNEFELSLIHKAARLVYHNVKSFPKSLGAAFAYMANQNFKETFSKGDFLLVIDLVDYNLSLTLLQGLYDENVKKDIPEYGGILWERHPSLSVNIHDEMDGITDKLLALGCIDIEQIYKLFGFDGLKSERDKLVSAFDDKHFFCFSNKVNDIVENSKINVTKQVETFLVKHKEIIGKGKIHIVSLASQLLYRGLTDFMYVDESVTINGCKTYEKLQNRSAVTLWRDHLPELAIKLLYGSFNLVDNETITPEFNVEKKISIPNAFTLTKGIDEYHFHLVQNDLNRKIQYAAIVKNAAFPLKQDIQCKLDMTYQYGADDPYRLSFIPIEKDAGFVEAKVSWKKVSEYSSENLPCPDFPASLTWNELQHFIGATGEIDLLYGSGNLLDFFHAISNGYRVFDLPELKDKLLEIENGGSFSVNFDSDDEKVTVVFKKYKQERQSYNKTINLDELIDSEELSSLTKVSCELEEIKADANLRYSCDLSLGSKYGEIWRQNENGYYCIRTLVIDKTPCVVKFYENLFLDSTNFSPNVSKVNFAIKSNKDNNKKAINIINLEDYGRKYYLASSWRIGARPGKITYAPRNTFILHSVFTGTNSIYDDSCPADLKAAFEEAINPWIDMYNNCQDDFIKAKIFSQMSLMALDIGKAYYNIANECITNYLDKKWSHIKAIGYSLGALDNDSEKEIFNRLKQLPSKAVIDILSRAIWANEEFIQNVDATQIIYYFDEAIEELSEIYQNGENVKNITACLELILGVFRLRQFKDKYLCRHISLNNQKVQKLYSIVEEMILLTQEGKLRINFFLKLEITAKNELYKDVPDILYALLVYITGDEGGSAIKISGLELDNLDV